MSTEHGVLIDGRWVGGGRHIHIVEKYSGRHLAAVTRARSSHVVQAVAAADRAMIANPINVEDRESVLWRVAAELTEQRSMVAQMLTKETGKPLLQAYAEVDEAAAALQYAVTLATQGKRQADAVTDLASPLIVSGLKGRGVTAAITSRIDPLLGAATCLGAVFAAGNSIIVKPSEKTPLTTMMLCDMFIQAGAPPGYINLLAGSGRGVGERLLKDERVTCAVVTGTDATLARARNIMRHRHFVGWGNWAAAGIILPDAHLDTAVETCVAKAFDHSGQRPGALERIYVHEHLYDTFVSAYKDRISQLTLGDPLASGTNIGCMIEMAEADRLATWVDEAVRAGADTITPTGQRGKQLAPAAVVNVPEQAKLFRERLAGPVVTIHNLGPANTLPVFRKHIDVVLLFTMSPDEAAPYVSDLTVGGMSVYGERLSSQIHLGDNTRQSMNALFRRVSIDRRIVYHW